MDLERRILERAANIPIERAEAERTRQAQAERQRSISIEQAREAERVMELGMRAVRLLIERNIAARPVNERLVVGKKTVPARGIYGNDPREVDEYDWVQTGSGWHIYRHTHVAMGGTSNQKIGLMNDGRLFETDIRMPASHLPVSASDQSHNGIDVHRWMSPDEAEQTLNSEYFERGMAHLVSGMRIPSFKSESPDIC